MATMKDYEQVIPNDNGYNPVWEAYNVLTRVYADPKSTKADYSAAVEYAIGYLGEALDK